MVLARRYRSALCSRKQAGSGATQRRRSCPARSSGLSQRDVNGTVNRHGEFAPCNVDQDATCSYYTAVINSSTPVRYITFTNNTANRKHRAWMRSDDFSTNLDFELVLEKQTSSGSWTGLSLSVGSLPTIDLNLGVGTYRWKFARRNGSGAFDSWRKYY